MKTTLILTILIASGLAFASPPEPISNNSIKSQALYLLTNPNGTGALYLNGKKIGDITNLKRNQLSKNAEGGDPPEKPDPTPTPDGPTFPKCSADDCGGGAPKPTPTPCHGPACPGGTNFETQRLIVVPQNVNRKFGSSLDAKLKQLIDTSK